MQLEIECKTCGATYAPTRAEILQGPETYRYCPACRAKPASRAA